MSSSDFSLVENEDWSRYKVDHLIESSYSSSDDDELGFHMDRSSAESDLGGSGEVPSRSAEKAQLIMNFANKIGVNRGQEHTIKKKRTRKKWIVALVPGCYPMISFDKKQADMVEEMIIEKLDSIQPGTGIAPVFDGWCFRSGGFVITCDSEPTKNWISDLAPELVVDRTTALIATDPNILIKNIKGRACFPGKYLTPNLVLAMLIRENTLTDIKMWSLTKLSEVPPRGFLANLGIPVTSIPELESKGYKVYFNREPVIVTVKQIDKIILNKIMNKN